VKQILSNKIKSGMNCKITTIIEKEDSGYFAFCPELKGCQSQGDTFDEALINIKETIKLYLKTLPEEEQKIYLSKEIFMTTIEVKVT
jgi:predicted RNase H-like HicB family nuclease